MAALLALLVVAATAALVVALLRVVTWSRPVAKDALLLFVAAELSGAALPFVRVTVLVALSGETVVSLAELVVLVASLVVLFSVVEVLTVLAALSAGALLAMAAVSLVA